MFLLLLSISGIIFIYHHVLYPKILKLIANKQKSEQADKAPLNHKACPSIGIFIAAYNEEPFIEEKLNNLACQFYPNDKIGIHLVTDGCTDDTAKIAKRVMSKLQEQFIYCTLDEQKQNTGKINALNLLIDKYTQEYDIVIFTDVSALVSVNSFNEIALSMQNECITALSGKYIPNSDEHDELDRYWQYQNAIRDLEGKLGAVNGFAGAMFAIRSSLVTKLDNNTINDDFVQIANTVGKESLACFNSDISIVECEADNKQQDLNRRVRIGAGNWQQLGVILKSITRFNTLQLFSFVSNKGLRGVMPLVIVCGYVSLIGLALTGQVFAQAMCVMAAVVHVIGLIKRVCSIKTKLAGIDTINYVAVSYLAGLIGIFTLYRFKNGWTRVNKLSSSTNTINYCKRLSDIVFSCLGIVMAAPIVLLAAIAIKLDSKGSVFYRQLRVGMISDEKADLIYVYKLRTMVQDAEKASGAVWAKGVDPRVTKVGLFLRKTRIDELPQLWNVLKGDMSIIGPRPERPVFYQKLERNIPFFIQRTYGIKPGISGLAQVMNGYDESIEDVRNKIAWDYSYALSMSKFSTWLRMECDIILKTIKVVVLGKGQ